MKVLDHGFVEVVNVMGTDRHIANVARVSTQSQGKSTPETDLRLTRRLMGDGHTSPFEFAVIEFHVKAPIFVGRQWMRHRTFAYSEISGRYTAKLPDESYVPLEWRLQHKTNRQGSSGDVLEGLEEMHTSTDYVSSLASADFFRIKAEEHGVAHEMARLPMPVAHYTEFRVIGSLHHWLKFLRLRTDEHAQWEIRQYANAIHSLLLEKFPVAVDAWSELVMDATTFTRQELDVVRVAIAGQNSDAFQKLSATERRALTDKLGLEPGTKL